MYKCDKYETERRLYCLVMQKIESDEIFDFIILFAKFLNLVYISAGGRLDIIFLEHRHRRMYVL